MNVLALITARGGSKGVPRKNVLPIAGKPLIAWTIEAALGCESIASVVVSTDDADIAEAAVSAGAEVPFLRPAELATDSATSFAVAMHALEQTAAPIDGLLLLQPTSPLREARDIMAVLERARSLDAPSIVSVVRPDCHPNWLYRMDATGRMKRYEAGPRIARRQDLPPVFAPNGAIYYSQVDWLRQTGDFIGAETIGHEMPPERSIDIDTPADWRLAETLLLDRAKSDRA